MSPGLLGSTVDSIARTGAKGNHVNDWKLGPLPGMLPRAWDDQEAPIPHGPRPWRSAIRHAVAAVRRLLATGGPASGEALAHGDHGDLNPG
jgi:hypothetical protein